MILTGTGFTALSSPCWLEIAAAPIGASVGTGSAHPTNYFGLALLRFEYEGWYYPAFSVDAADQLVACPQLVTGLAYEISSGTTLTVTAVACLTPLLDDAEAFLYDSNGLELLT